MQLESAARIIRLILHSEFFVEASEKNSSDASAWVKKMRTAFASFHRSRESKAKCQLYLTKIARYDDRRSAISKIPRIVDSLGMLSKLFTL